MNKTLERQYVTVLEECIAGSRLDSFAKVGRLVRISTAGDVYVDFVGNERGPVLARIAVSGEDMLTLQAQEIGARLLLVLEDGSLGTPIIIGLVKDRLPLQHTEKKEVSVDGRAITIDGKEEVVLRCGKSSISLKKNGKIIVKGVDLVSRAMRQNRIRGGTVKIN